MRFTEAEECTDMSGLVEVNGMVVGGKIYPNVLVEGGSQFEASIVGLHWEKAMAAVY